MEVNDKLLWYLAFNGSRWPLISFKMVDEMLKNLPPLGLLPVSESESEVYSHIIACWDTLSLLHGLLPTLGIGDSILASGRWAAVFRKVLILHGMILFWETLKFVYFFWQTSAHIAKSQQQIIIHLLCQTSIISCTLISNKFVDHSDAVGASPVSAAPTTFSFSA